MMNCIASGVMLLCGEDGHYYVNYCFITMRSCEAQSEVKVHAVGQSSHCSPQGSPFAALLSENRIPGYDVCGMEDNHCYNFGICLKNNQQRICLCPRHYHGNRCQYRDAPLNNIDYAMSRSNAIIGKPPTSQVHGSPTIVLVLCVISGLFTSIVTSAVCYRIRARDMKRHKDNTIRHKESNLNLENDSKKAASVSGKETLTNRMDLILV
ncbi:uncharacterized protein LOC100183301 [Ciona intestinalis]